MVIKSNTICPLPWIHFSTHTNGIMRICCNTENGGHIHKQDGKVWKVNEINDLLQYFNSDDLKNVRKEMLHGKKPSMCNSCYKLEDKGSTSVRKTQLKNYEFDSLIKNTNIATGELSSVDVYSLDFSWGNKCNLKCKMCFPDASNQLIDEWRQLGILKKDDEYFRQLDENWKFENNLAFFDLICGNLKEILVTGGEPLINDDFYKLCKYLIEKGVSKNIILKFHTNLTVTPKKFVDVWKYFKFVLINCSIDATKDTYEYIRYPGKWKIVSENFVELIEYSKTIELKIDVHTVFTPFNAHDTINLIEFFAEYDIFPYFNRIQNPVYTDSRCLPRKFKNKLYSECHEVIKKYENTFRNHWSNEKVNTLKANLDIMISEDLDTELFYNFVDKQDSLRTIKSVNILPWYKK